MLHHIIKTLHPPRTKTNVITVNIIWTLILFLIDASYYSGHHHHPHHHPAGHPHHLHQHHDLHDDSFVRRKQRRNRTTFTLQQAKCFPQYYYLYMYEHGDIIICAIE